MFNNVDNVSAYYVYISDNVIDILASQTEGSLYGTLSRQIKLGNKQDGGTAYGTGTTGQNNRHIQSHGHG